MFTYKAASFLVHIELLFINSPFPHQPLIIKRRKKKERKKMENQMTESWTPQCKKYSASDFSPLKCCLFSPRNNSYKYNELHYSLIFIFQTEHLVIVQKVQLVHLLQLGFCHILGQSECYIPPNKDNVKLRAINQQLSCSMCYHIHNKQVWGQKNQQQFRVCTWQWEKFTYHPFSYILNFSQ